jgi:hypothetical protein
MSKNKNTQKNTRDSKPANVEPKLAKAEWDFTSVSQVRLPYVIAYEYKRSQQQLSGEAQCSQVPSSRLSDQDLVEAVRSDLAPYLPGFAIWPWLAQPKTIARSGPKQGQWIPSPHGQWFSINWKYTDKAILAAFADWLKRHRKGGTPVEQRGKRAHPPFHLLRILAAWRLKKAGFSYDQASSHVRIGVASDKNSVLPSYSTADSWKRATKSAETWIRKGINYPEIGCASTQSFGEKIRKSRAKNP